MKSIYLINFESYYCAHICGLKYERVGKLPVVKVSRLKGDLPFIDYFKMRFFWVVGSRMKFIAEAISYRVDVSEGMEDVTWLKDGNSYTAFDNFAGEHVPNMRRVNPPTRKVVKKGVIRDTGKTRTA